jgi:hypothetical protein
MEHAEQRLRAALDDGDLDAIEFFSTLVDDLENKQRRPPPGLADAALWYASLGLHVFPLSPRSKMPRAGTHGLKDATTDQRLIAQWWAVDSTRTSASRRGTSSTSSTSTAAYSAPGRSPHPMHERRDLISFGTAQPSIFVAASTLMRSMLKLPIVPPFVSSRRELS